MTAAIIESERYANEAQKLAKNPVVIAAAVDLILNDVDFDPTTFESMQNANSLLTEHDLTGESVGGAARAIGLARHELEANSVASLPPRDLQAAHAVAVNVYVHQPEVKEIEPLHHNILEILSAVDSVHGTPDPVASFREVAKHFLIVRHFDLNS